MLATFFNTPLSEARQLPLMFDLSRLDFRSGGQISGEFKSEVQRGCLGLIG